VFSVDPETNTHELESIYFPGEDIMCFYDTIHNANGFHRELTFSVALTNYHVPRHPDTTNRFSQDMLWVRSSFTENVGMVKCLTCIGAFIPHAGGLLNLIPDNHFYEPPRSDTDNDDDQGPDGNNNDGKGDNNDGKGDGKGRIK
jgi:hypothetical protein